MNLKSLIRSLLLKYNYFIGVRIDPQSLVSFINSLKPIKIDKELIRLGGPFDGGYLIPNDLNGVEVCFSPGVSATSDFENDLTKKGIKCYLADYSVDSPPLENSLFDFEKKYLGTTDDSLYMTLESWVKNKAPDKKDFILQMDIEGGEYPVILHTPDEIFNRFRIIVIEFHFLNELFTKAGFTLIKYCFSKLLKNFDIVHIHPNNVGQPIGFDNIRIPPIMEFTFLRKDRVIKKGVNSKYPHVLDRPNVKRLPDLILPDCWYKS